MLCFFLDSDVSSEKLFNHKIFSAQAQARTDRGRTTTTTTGRTTGRADGRTEDERRRRTDGADGQRRGDDARTDDGADGLFALDNDGP